MESSIRAATTPAPGLHVALLKAGSPRLTWSTSPPPLHREALAIQLHETPAGPAFIFRSIDPWPFNTSLWKSGKPSTPTPRTPAARQAAREFYENIKKPWTPAPPSFGPRSKTSIPSCAQAPRAAGRPSEREKQNCPLNPDSCEWPASYFHEGHGLTSGPPTSASVLALDPSKGAPTPQRGDYSAFISLGIDRQGILYVQADPARRPTPQMVADGVELFRNFRPHAFGIEANQFQELLAPTFDVEFRRAWSASTPG